MGYQVIISPRARLDLKGIVSHIAPHNSEAALRYGNLLIQRALSLDQLPWRGRVVPELGEFTVREIILKPHRIIYQISEETQSIAILRFWHAARGTPEIE